MNPGEVSRLLAGIVLLDGRVQATEATVALWHRLLHDVPFDAAQAAVLMHYSERETVIMPATIRARAFPALPREIVSPTPPVDPDDTRAYADWQREWLRARRRLGSDEAATRAACDATGTRAIDAPTTTRTLALAGVVRSIPPE